MYFIQTERLQPAIQDRGNLGSIYMYIWWIANKDSRLLDCTGEQLILVFIFLRVIKIALWCAQRSRNSCSLVRGFPIWRRTLKALLQSFYHFNRWWPVIQFIGTLFLFFQMSTVVTWMWFFGLRLHFLTPVCVEIVSNYDTQYMFSWYTWSI